MESEFVLSPKFQLDSPYLADYFGVWAIHEPTFKALVEQHQGVNLTAHIKSEDVKQEVGSRDRKDYAMNRDGIATFRINGPMMKFVSSMQDGTSTVRLRQQIRAARKDPDVLGGMLILDTPGGTVKGNQDLADEVAAFAAEKPLYAYTEDMTASAGVSVASQATKRFANNATALYGSMGTYAVLYDMSGRAEQLGVKVHVVRAGEFKGMGEPGSEITEAQVAELQRIVNRMNDNYLSLIARGVGKSVDALRPLADGRILFAADAAEQGLIHGVQTFEQTYQQLLQEVSKKTFTTSPNRGKSNMDKQPATLAELKATFPNSTAEWRESQLEAGADISGAAISYAQFVEAKAADERAAHAKAVEEAASKAKAETLAEVAKSKGGLLGHQPLTARLTEEAYEGDTGDAVEDFNAAVAKVAGVNADLGKRQRAVRQVATQKPELYQAYLLATNPGKRQARLITEKLEAISGK